MATKHKKKKVGARKGHRKHRVGAHGKLEQAALTAIGVVGGALLTPFLIQAANTALGSNAATIPAPLVPGAIGLAGAGIAYAGDKMAIVKGAGMGMFAVGALMAANEMGLNEPGIAGLSAGSNTSYGTAHLSNAVGCKKMGNANYLNKTVGRTMARRTRRAMAVGALISE